MSETRQHLALKKKMKTVMERCGFVTDSEVHLDIDGDGQDDRSFDVCAMYEDTLIVIECKDGGIEGIKGEIAAWKQDISRILNNSTSIKVLSSNASRILDKSFNDIEKIKLIFAFSYRVQPDELVFRELKRNNILVWDERAVMYYDRTSSTLGEWTKYEILRELDLFMESRSSFTEDAIQIRQGKENELFLMGMHPGLLLKIAYVLRRTSNKPDAYQRVINKDRIEKIGDFLKGSSVLLPNSIIIAFDEDVETKLLYNKKEKSLSFPVKYCSAWIIDGQHRLYGFTKTNYREWSEDANDEFKLPVVAFRNLRQSMQNKTFVNINYYQKRIDATLLCDLAASIMDMTNELTWPSKLVIGLNERDPWKEMVKISEFDTKKPIGLSGFARYSLLETLLGYKKASGIYDGPLYRYEKFDPRKPFDDPMNNKAFNRQLDLLSRFFMAVRKSVENSNPHKDPWLNSNDYALTRTTSVNALLLVLNRIMERHPRVDLDLNKYLKPLGEINYSRERISRTGGWKGFRLLANELIAKLEEYNKDGLEDYHKRKQTIV